MKSSTRLRDSRLFPRHFHWIIFILTVIFRIRYVINKDNWWILHPDEIYQTLEVAHSELYGFGFRPYEYLQPPDLNDPNITIARKHEYHLGMYSLRSFIIPKIYTYVGYCFLYFGYSGSLFVMWKVFHTAVSSLLILSVYKFTTCMYGCHDTGVLSAFMCACSIHLNIMSTHTLINSFLSPFVYLILADVLERSSSGMVTTTKHNNENNSANNNNEYYSRFIIAIFLGIRDDYVSYGSVILSPWQWIKFNVGGNLSSKLFGVEPTLFYVRILLLDDWINFLLLTLSSSLFLLFAVYTVLIRHRDSSPIVMLEVKLTKQLMLIVFCLLCLYSSKGHKEIRFVHDVIPLILILYSRIILVVCELGVKLCKSKQCLYMILILTAAIQWKTFISLDKYKISKWSYRGIDNSNHVNKCLDFISRQQNVTGVFLDADFHMSGGFSILRHNVSVLALNQKEYFKFEEDARITVKSNFISNGTHSIFTLSRVSDFISTSNQRYLWKSIIEDSSINYLIVTGRRLLKNSAFVEIYTSGDFKLLKRTFDSMEELAVYSMSNATSSVDNSDILNMEADWLIYYGSYVTAKERLTYILKIDERNLKSHQLLIQLYHIKSDNKAARASLQKCRKYHDRKTCLLTPNHFNMK
ncbi:uncharacterized protein LOC134681454 [Mytilus trossulus]|uniref:uncharacterized protein LOC134681454 n=1 Tax=Mytilus trossulus TaxID=6551 RepID=UPI003004EFD6